MLEVLLGDAFVLRWSFTPAAFTAFLNGTGSAEALVTVCTSMFLHGGLGHLLGNMVFLWVFGQATEDAFGSRMYVLFYLACGVVATFAQYAVAPNSTVPNLGASGAIAGVMGAYLAMYPDSRIDVFAWPLSLLLGRDLRVPAWLLLGGWFAVQLSSGVGTATSADGRERRGAWPPWRTWGVPARVPARAGRAAGAAPGPGPGPGRRLTAGRHDERALS